MKNRSIQLRTLAGQLLPRHLNVAACITYRHTRILRSNWGDELNYFFLSQLFNRRVCVVDYSWLCRFGLQPHYLMIGSIISLKCTTKSIVWGAGVLADDAPLPAAPARVLAVRGPRTRRYLLRHGINCPGVYGDPALLLPLVYRPHIISKKYPLGVIPHYSELDSPSLHRFLRRHPEARLISLRHYQKWTDIIDAVCSCEAVLSSSLHGIIAAEAYGIPNAWIQLSDGNIIGGEFKYRDFYEAVGKHHLRPVAPEQAETALNQWSPIRWDPTELINSAPFPISPCRVN